jgi:fermentation-respiration switch protein FrsA (DUF1100 family)
MYLTALVLLYAGLLLLVYVYQGRLLFVPGRHLAGTPAAEGLAFEEVTLETHDGEALHGWWVPATPERAVVLFPHGNAGNIADRVGFLTGFQRLGLSIFMFDYRGYGRSTGRPTEKGLYRDAETAWHYLTTARGTPASGLVLFGRSLGASVATWLALKHRPAALILESPFTSVPDLAARLYWYLPVRLLARLHFDNVRRIPGLQAPLLVLHSSEDELIPFAHGKQVFAAAPEPKVFLQITGTHGNNFRTTGPAYWDGIDDFLTAHLPPEPPGAGPETTPENASGTQSTA